MRPDWRRTVRKRLDIIGPHQDVRVQLKQQREELKTKHYNQVTPGINFHRRATMGIPLPHDTNRTREDEITLHQLRLNRFPNLQQTLHRFGKADSPNCLECNEVEKTSEHFLLHCPRWTEERHQHLGHEPTQQKLNFRMRPQISDHFLKALVGKDPHILKEGSQRNNNKT